LCRSTIAVAMRVLAGLSAAAWAKAPALIPVANNTVSGGPEAFSFPKVHERFTVFNGKYSGEDRLEVYHGTELIEAVSTTGSIYTYFGDFDVGSTPQRYAVALLAESTSGKSGIFVHSGSTSTDKDQVVVELGAAMPGRNETFAYLADPSIFLLEDGVRVAFMAKGTTDYRAVYMGTSKNGGPFELEVVVDETSGIPGDKGYFFKCFYGPQVTMDSLVFFGSHCGTKSIRGPVDDNGYGPIEAEAMRRKVVGSTTAADHVLKVDHLDAGIFTVDLRSKAIHPVASMSAATKVPGKGNETFTSFSEPVVSGSFAAFAGLSSGGAVGLYRYDSKRHALSKVVDTTDTVPGADFPYSDFPRGCSVGADGAVAFYAVAPSDNTGIFAQDSAAHPVAKLLDMNTTVESHTLDYIGFGAEGYTADAESIVTYLVLLNASSPILGVWELQHIRGESRVVV